MFRLDLRSSDSVIKFEWWCTVLLPFCHKFLLCGCRWRRLRIPRIEISMDSEYSFRKANQSNDWVAYKHSCRSVVAIVIYLIAVVHTFNIILPHLFFSLALFLLRSVEWSGSWYTHGMTKKCAWKNEITIFMEITSIEHTQSATQTQTKNNWRTNYYLLIVGSIPKFQKLQFIAAAAPNIIQCYFTGSTGVTDCSIYNAAENLIRFCKNSIIPYDFNDNGGGASFQCDHFAAFRLHHIYVSISKIYR